jgi:hypothetical protein
MILKTSSGKNVGFYVPSFNRYDKIKTGNLISCAKYVVRESEKDLYINAIVSDRVWAVADNLISDLGATRQYIINNSDVDIVVQLDDDITAFRYVNKLHRDTITDETVIVDEFLRMCQILEDLKLGFGATKMVDDTRKYRMPFVFNGIIGICVFFNKEYLKGVYEVGRIKVDIDFLLQELLYNRIAIIPAYIVPTAEYDVNKGGNNKNKLFSKIVADNDYYKAKWGKYYKYTGNSKRNTTQAIVER